MFRGVRVSLAWWILMLGVACTCHWERGQFCMDELQVGFRTHQGIRLDARRDDLRIHVDQLPRPEGSWPMPLDVGSAELDA
jgi:hypothetical protein